MGLDARPIKMAFSKETKEMVSEAQNGFCKWGYCGRPIHSFHHRVHNTKANRKKYKLFINSPFNCVGLCQKCHTYKSHEFKITESEAEIYEKWLQKLKKT